MLKQEKEKGHLRGMEILCDRQEQENIEILKQEDKDNLRGT